MMNIGKILPGYRIIEKDEKICFKCDMCGNCCRNKDDILLNGYDVFRISDYLKLTVGELVLSYCKVYIGPNSNIPCVTLLPLGPYKICPFLIQRKCTINEVKPINCAMYPLGRIQDGTTGEEHYIINSIDCGTKDKE